MQHPSRLLRALLLAACAALAGVGVSAQTTPASNSGIQSANILDIQPEASADPGYATQTNAERAKVQPRNNAPMWRQVGTGVTGFSSLPKSQAPEAGNLIQPSVQYPGSRLTNAGDAWRQVRNNWLIPYGGSLLVIVILSLAFVYFAKGPMKTTLPATGRKIERFTPFERAAHWSNAIAFVALGVSGVVMAYGKFFLLPVMGLTLFGWLTYALKNLHNFAGPLFAVSMVVVFVTFLKDNWPEKGDWQWVLKGGGMLGGHAPATNRFNPGSKAIFWGGVFFLGLIIIASGFVMDKIVPGLIYERGTMQIAHMAHAVTSVLMLAMFLAHAYLGSVGMEGAYEGMRHGYVDEAWAKEHHEYWYDDIKSGKIPAQRTVLTPTSPPITSSQPV
ncbi:MAG: formate dehydrogenase subunit gamma [Polaromonas sp.]|jgi:formate dehydrogenase subunit gamma